MATVTVEKAGSNLSDLITRAAAGEEIVISRDNEPVAKLVPIAAAELKPVRRPGALKDLLGKIPDSFFFDPLPDDELEAWEGKYSFPGDNGQ